MAGIKRGTISLACDYGEGREPMPKPGDFRYDARRRTASTVRLANHRGDDQAAISGGRSVRLGTKASGTARETGGSMLIAYISPGNRDRSGSSDREILTVFERFEGV
jgi:hypothetical protein